MRRELFVLEIASVADNLFEDPLCRVKLGCGFSCMVLVTNRSRVRANVRQKRCQNRDVLVSNRTPGRPSEFGILRLWPLYCRMNRFVRRVLWRLVSHYIVLAELNSVVAREANVVCSTFGSAYSSC